MTSDPRLLLLLLVSMFPGGLAAESTLRFCIRAEPRTFHPLLVDDDSSETVRYLTGGVLVRLNRKTQQVEPALAKSWKVSAEGRQVDFVLRPGVRFSDGSPFSPADVVYTMQQLVSPALHSPTADSFRTGAGDPVVSATGPNSVRILFPKAISGVVALFDQVAILCSHLPFQEKTVLGPYTVAEHKPGSFVLLRKNPNYWDRDAQGHPLPRIDAIRLDVQQSRDGEALRLQRGEIDFVQNLDPDLFDRMNSQRNNDFQVVDLGASLDSELIWFNQAPNSHLPPFRQAWFRDTHFRRAISLAIDRDQICRIVYRGHATAARGPVSPSNKIWFNERLPMSVKSIEAAKRELAASGFHLAGDRLEDRLGNPVEFSLISNSGNRNHERTMALLQQNLQQLGVRLNVVTLDFASLIERITRSFDYEACLMSLTNVGLDPNEQMNVWLSSASNHQWNPNQKQPATTWEARLDQLMTGQASAPDQASRKKLFDEVQMIAAEQQPFIYLVHPDVLTASTKRIQNQAPALVRPQLYWNVEKQLIADDRRH